ncbi:long-chain-alcohol oxidase FAO4A [Olea europaea subsp. europaea]|uniref:Long-chain-alcohol oxidase n=1 Tax=Olea europaea subsp. europaea TaxID=158383 RepID=A0A8S0SJG3_OLEEU|nr:long-chain-alcohol oxidase FAO4A [Olea europaea subsp. europaea]
MQVSVLLKEKLQHPKIYLSRLALWALSTWIGTFVLCGRLSLSSHFPYFLRFSQISLHKREQILLSWSSSYISLLRLLFTAAKIFTLLIFFTQVNEKEENVSWKAIGYCGPDPNFKNKKRSGERRDQEDSSEDDMSEPLYKGIINLYQPRQIIFDKLEKLGFSVSIPHSKTPKMKSFNPSFVIKCDAVVVGSGSGGGVIAGVLAKAGYKVLVLEKGSYFSKKDLTLLEGQAMDQMYLGHGILATENMDILLLAGSTVGGGSTINWSASFRTPAHIMKEWSEDYSLKLFESKLYQEALDIVCQKMGVQSEIKEEGFNNMILRKGCQNLGFPVENVPRNSPSDHYCGWCCLGCKDGKKKDTTETWLVDLVDSGNGAILPECEAIRVVHKRNDKVTGRRSIAVGVAFEFQHRGVKEIGLVESEVTVIACGALCTPALLKRSGLKNPNIGKNLHVHPVIMGWGYFPDTPSSDVIWPEADKKSYKGGILTAMSKVTVNPEDSGHNAIIQTPALHPGMFASLFPWSSGLEFKTKMRNFSRTTHIFALARDKGSGTVTNPSTISYKFDNADEENLKKGLERVLRILAAAGAEEIGTHHGRGKTLKVKEASLEELEKFVKEESSRPVKNLSTSICSAHQMGSCRMGVDSSSSAVDSKAETWEVERLFVADSSVFPTALGVNPMVTIQAISYCTAQSVIEVLGRKTYI